MRRRRWTSVIWALALLSAPHFELFGAACTVLRFAALPVFLAPRPKIAWPRLAWIQSLFTGQFLLLFLLIAAVVGHPRGPRCFSRFRWWWIFPRGYLSLRQRPHDRGLCRSGADRRHGPRPMALGSTCRAFSWAVGNILVKRAASAGAVAGRVGEPRPAIAVLCRLADRRAATRVKRAEWFAGAVPPPRAEGAPRPARPGFPCAAFDRRAYEIAYNPILDYITRKIKGGMCSRKSKTEDSDPLCTRNSSVFQARLCSLPLSAFCSHSQPRTLIASDTGGMSAPPRLAGGDGSASAPFNSLALVQQASWPRRGPSSLALAG